MLHFGSDRPQISHRPPGFSIFPYAPHYSCMYPSDTHQHPRSPRPTTKKPVLPETPTTHITVSPRHRPKAHDTSTPLYETLFSTRQAGSEVGTPRCPEDTVKSAGTLNFWPWVSPGHPPTGSRLRGGVLKIAFELQKCSHLPINTVENHQICAQKAILASRGRKSLL
jgi:hypothetical protein